MHPYRRECRIDETADGYVIEAGQCNIPRYLQTCAIQGEQAADSHGVVRSEHGVGAVGHGRDLLARAVSTLLGKIARERLQTRTAVGERIAKAGQPSGGIEVAVRTLDENDVAMAASQEMPAHREGAAVIVDVQSGLPVLVERVHQHGRQGPGHVIIHHGRVHVW